MARAPRDPRARLDRPGERPLLQGHLRRGGRRPEPGQTSATEADQPGKTTEGVEQSSGQPAAKGARGAAGAARGKTTRSPAEVATRPHREGPEQGPR